MLTIIRISTFSAPYAVRLLNLKWYAFFLEMTKSIISVIVLSFILHIIKALIPAGGWISLIISGTVSGILGLTINIILFLNKYYRKIIEKAINFLKRTKALSYVLGEHIGLVLGRDK